MNKYIIPQLMISLLVTFCANAMESNVVSIDKDPSIPNSDVYCLATMPMDIQNYIASFLMESEKEFIERTKIIKKVPLNLYSEFLLKSTKEFLRIDDSYNIIISEFCPDGTKIGIIELPCSRMRVVMARLAIIDLQKKDDTKILYISDELDHKRLALSRDGSMIAKIYEETDCYEGEICSYDIFEIQKVATQKKREIYIPDAFVHEIIAFNKQGTLLIAHGKNPDTKKDMYQIFPLKIINLNKPQVVDGPNNLQNYFRDKFVCNLRIEGLK